MDAPVTKPRMQSSGGATRRTIDRPFQPEEPENTLVPGPIQGIEPSHLTIVFQPHLLPRIAIAEKGQIRL